MHPTISREELRERGYDGSVTLLTSRALKVGRATRVRRDKVVAVHRGGHSGLRQAGGHELQQGHLGSGILAGHTVGAETQVGLATLDLLAVRVIQVTVHDLLGHRQRAVEALTNNVEVLLDLRVGQVVALASLDPAQLNAVLENIRLDLRRLLGHRGKTTGEAGPQSRRTDSGDAHCTTRQHGWQENPGVQRHCVFMHVALEPGLCAFAGVRGRRVASCIDRPTRPLKNAS